MIIYASLFLSQKEFDAIKDKLNHIEFAYEKVSNQKIYLNGILFNDENDYTVWINDKAYKSEGSHTVDDDVHIIEVTENNVTLKIYDKNITLMMNQTYEIGLSKIMAGDTRKKK